MDKDFMRIAATGLILIALGSLSVCAFKPENQSLVVALVGIISTCSGALAGVMAAPRFAKGGGNEKTDTPAGA